MFKTSLMVCDAILLFVTAINVVLQLRSILGDKNLQ